MSVLLAGYGTAYGLLPPAPSSTTYTTNDGVIVIEFSEPVTMIDYSKIHIRGGDISITLADVSVKQYDTNTNTITATFDFNQKTTFETMLLPRLAVDHAAVHGRIDTPILEGRHIITIHDTTPPEFVSAIYNATDRQVRITFDERIVTLGRTPLE